MGEWIILVVAAWYVTRRFDVRAWGQRLGDSLRRSPWLRPGGRARLENLLHGAWRDVLELAGDATSLVDTAGRQLRARRSAQRSTSIPGPAAEALASLELSMGATTRDRPEPDTSPRPHPGARGSGSTPPLRSVSP